jgi:hypothetical protein
MPPWLLEYLFLPKRRKFWPIRDRSYDYKNILAGEFGQKLAFFTQNKAI